MFEKFYDFVGVENKNNVTDMSGFMDIYGGETFLNGLYRIHNKNDVKKWNETLKRAFPKFKNGIQVFGYDWLGRNFALDTQRDVVLIFEPGTGEAFDTDFNFYDFHNKEIPTNHLVCLASEYYEKWRKANNNYILPHNKCAGYKVPLFLNGKDVVENLEISDMEVYWEIMMPLINL